MNDLVNDISLYLIVAVFAIFPHSRKSSRPNHKVSS